MADRLAERLSSHFDEVFIDADALESADNARAAVGRVVGKCDFVVAVIGPKWADAVHDQQSGQNRVGGPMAEDIQLALDRGITVVPVMVDGTRLPGRAGLPEALAGILDRAHVDVRSELFEADTARMIAFIYRALDSTGVGQKSGRAGGPDATGRAEDVCDARLLSPNGHAVSDGYLFLSYSRRDAGNFADRLAERMVAEAPHYPVWLDRRELRPGEEWDAQIERAIDHCAILLFVMSNDGVGPLSVCHKEWSRALAEKKLVIPLRLHEGARSPLRLDSVQFVDFCVDFEAGLGDLRRHLEWNRSREGQRHALATRLIDAQRELVRPGQLHRRSIEAEIDDLLRRLGRG